VTPDEAIKRIIFHTQAQNEPGAFLDMLRPYRGLRDDVLLDVKACLRAVATRLTEPELPRELVSALWAISYFGRFWALEPDGMLRRNHLISDADLARLATFLGHFDYAVAMLLDGAIDEAFANWRTDP
jgi:hypothetical protein